MHPITIILLIILSLFTICFFTSVFIVLFGLKSERLCKLIGLPPGLPYTGDETYEELGIVMFRAIYKFVFRVVYRSLRSAFYSICWLVFWIVLLAVSASLLIDMENNPVPAVCVFSMMAILFSLCVAIWNFMEDTVEPKWLVNLWRKMKNELDAAVEPAETGAVDSPILPTTEEGMVDYAAMVRQNANLTEENDVLRRYILTLRETLSKEAKTATEPFEEETNEEIQEDRPRSRTDMIDLEDRRSKSWTDCISNCCSCR